MLSLLTILALSPQPAMAQKVPAASYELSLESYDIQLRDYRFPSGLRIIFQSESSQPIVAITSAIDRGSEFDQKDMDGIAHVVEHLAFRAQHGEMTCKEYQGRGAGVEPGIAPSHGPLLLA